METKYRKTRKVHNSDDFYNGSASSQDNNQIWDKHDRLILRDNNGERYDVNDELMSLKKIEGKTIRSVITNGEKSIRNYHVRLDFTDGTHIDFLKCDPYQLYNDNQVGKIFLTLWDKAGTKEYDKNEWMYFQELLASRGVNV